MTDNRPIDERYFDWLRAILSLSNHRHPARYEALCERLYKTPFYWFIHNDDNRVEDGRDLRLTFMFDVYGEIDDVWVSMDASVLEVIMGIANRLGFMTEEDAGDWFWQLIDHLGLIDCTDANWTRDTSNRVDATIKRFMDRTYEPDGRGGLFPLQHPAQDQRDTEIWYQMSAYVLERMR